MFSSVPPPLTALHRRVVSYVSQNAVIFGTCALSIVLLTSIWVLHFARVTNEKNLAVQGALDNGRNIVSIIETNLAEVLGRSALYASIAGSYIDSAHTAHTAAPYLNPQQVGDTAYLRAAIFDGSGKLVYSSAKQRDEAELRPLLDRQVAGGVHVQSLRPEVLVGHPTGSSEGAWRLPLLVPLSAGGFYGAVIDLGYFLSRYRDVEFGRGGSIEIVHEDGVVLAALRGGTLSLDTRLQLPLPVSAAQLPGNFSPTRGNDKFLRSVRKLSRYPILVAATQDSDELFAKLTEQHRSYRNLSIIYSAAVIVITAGILSSLRQQRRLRHVAAQSEQEKLRLIDLLEQEKARALAQASHDYLTGIPNRRMFNDLASAELKRARRSKYIYALLFFDLDRFKLVNDTLGHAVGDLLLKAVAQRLRENLRDYDLVARLGGDEFVVLLSEIKTEASVAQLAAELVQELSRVYPDLNGHDVETSPSIGIALYPRDGQTIEELLTHADRAMYDAKAEGRGRFSFYDASLNASSARRSELIARLRSAIQDNEFCLHFQPKVDLNTLRIVGLEALIRWQHPEHGMIFPGEFISFAEEEGYIVPLGQWVIHAACEQIAQWKRDGLPGVPVAINISACQLHDERFPADVMAALAKHGVAAEMLEIEITESAIIEDTQLAQRNLEILAAAGVKVALDDFGTGFSGLSRLKQLPIDAVKIDRSFIRDIRKDTSDAVIVASTITLAHNLGLIVIAEGVESKDQLVHLKAAGCDQVQGFYLHRPAAARDIAPILQKGYLSLHPT